MLEFWEIARLISWKNIFIQKISMIFANFHEKILLSAIRKTKIVTNDDFEIDKVWDNSFCTFHNFLQRKQQYL